MYQSVTNGLRGDFEYYYRVCILGTNQRGHAWFRVWVTFLQLSPRFWGEGQKLQNYLAFKLRHLVPCSKANSCTVGSVSRKSLFRLATKSGFVHSRKRTKSDFVRSQKRALRTQFFSPCAVRLARTSNPKQSSNRLQKIAQNYKIDSTEDEEAQKNPVQTVSSRKRPLSTHGSDCTRTGLKALNPYRGPGSICRRV